MYTQKNKHKKKEKKKEEKKEEKESEKAVPKNFQQKFLVCITPSSKYFWPEMKLYRVFPDSKYSIDITRA